MQSEDLRALLAERVEEDGPGVVAMVVHNGEILAQGGRGFASLEWRQPVAADTVLGLGSLTKPFTAQAVLLLERANKVRIEEQAATYLPELTWLDPRITVTHLLTHTSGVANYVTQPGFWERIAWQNWSTATLAEYIGTLSPDFPPGERYSYSNSAYLLLGLLIERVSGMAYDDYLRAAIFEPLGMRDTCFLWDAPIVPRLAGRYALPESDTTRYTHPRYLNPIFTFANGGLASTLDDLRRWDAAMREYRLLPENVERRMQETTTLNDGRAMGYGLGWGLSTYRGHRVVHHAGGVPGYSSFLGRFIDDGVTIIVLSNRGGFDGADFAADIANVVLALPTPEYVAAEPMQEHLAAAVGTYTNLVGARMEVVRDGEGLAMRGARKGSLIPLDAATYTLVGSPDVVLHFDALAEGHHRRLTVVVPLYWYEMERSATPEKREL